MQDNKKHSLQNDEQNIPRFWHSFLKWFCPSRLYEGIEGDLLQQFDIDQKLRGDETARKRFAWNVIGFFRPGIIFRNRVTVSGIQSGMLVNYLKVAWRNMAGNRTYTVINITGLTLGISIAIVLFWILRFEYSFDCYHENADRLYQIKSHDKFGEPNSHVPQGVIHALTEQFPDVEKAATVYGWSPQVIRVGNENLKVKNTFFLDPEFLEMIDVNWIAGSLQESLREPFQVVLDHPTAIRLFGDQDPRGQIIRYDNTLDLVVSGIIGEMPVNSEFRFEMIMSYETLVRYMDNYANRDHWGGGDSWFHGYVLVKPGADIGNIEGKLASMVSEHKDNTTYTSFELAPITKAHFDTKSDTFNYVVPLWMLHTLSGIAAFLILIAIINFVNLATAQATQRSREIGVRKVMGGSRRSIVMQFYTETGVLVAVSLIAGCFIASHLVTFAPEFFNTKVDQTDVWEPEMFLYLFLLAISVTLIAGSYPAMLLSGLKPVRILQNQLTLLSGRSISLRKLLVVIQFVIAQVMVICMVVGRDQMQYFYQTDLGFDKDAVLTVNMPFRDSVLLQERFRQQLLQHPEIKSVTYGLTSPSSDRNWWWGNTFHPGLLNGEQTFRLQWIDENYLDFYNIDLIAGRNFVATDSLPVALINEKAVRSMGLTDPAQALGEKLKYWGNNEVTVIGVVKDYFSQGLKAEIPPHLYLNGNWNFQLAQIKIDPLQSAGAIRSVENHWKEMHPDNYFEYKFLSDELNTFYEDERKFSNFILLFSAIGIAIGCLGLFGLVSFVCVRRSREISIRKVLGATLSNIITLLSRDFFVMVLIALVIAVPLGWYLMNNFLQRYTYHIEMKWTVFAIAGIMTIVLALFTVIIRSFKAAHENPVERLKCE